mmetsp:Transcript_17603/g.35777  ORF Transcript_17603/g.35777 Transcript_17603/m.35777 type:complete len:206 (-) Transcript_17603:41-658(-)
MLSGAARRRGGAWRSISSLRDIISSLSGASSSSPSPSSSSSAPNSSASVPFVIPRSSKLRLHSDLDWSASEIKVMTPALAKALVDSDARRPEKLGDFTRAEMERLVETMAGKEVDDGESEGEGEGEGNVNDAAEERQGERQASSSQSSSTTDDCDDDAMWEVVTTDDEGEETTRGHFRDAAEADFVVEFHGKRGRTGFKRRRAKG